MSGQGDFEDELNEERANWKTMTAIFPRLDRAKHFVDRLNEGRDRTRNVVRRGKTVVFEATMLDEDSFTHWCELVGHIGTLQPGFMAPRSKMAHLNGVPCVGEY